MQWRPSAMWPANFCLCMLSVLMVCRAVPINRDFSSNDRAIYVDRSNEKFGNDSVCVSDDVLYKEGDSLPTGDVCESCICKPPKFSCETVKCEVELGCRAIHRSNQCCPEYQCECERDGKTYQNGERMDADSPCQACYCRSGEIVCTLIECYRRDDCEPRYVNGTCCPKYDHCPPLEPTPMMLYTSSPSPLEQKYPSSSEHEANVDVASTNSNNILQENTVDSLKKVDILGEIMSDSPNSAQNSLNEFEEEPPAKSSGTDISETEILVENMSEVYTERTSITSFAEETEQTDTEESSENIKMANDSTQSSEIQSEFISSDKSTQDSKETITEEKENSNIEGSKEVTTENSSDLTTLKLHSSEEMRDEGKPAWFYGEVKKTGEPYGQEHLDSIPSGNEETQEEEEERDSEIAITKVLSGTGKEEISTTKFPASFEHNDYIQDIEGILNKFEVNAEYGGSSEEQTKDEVISTTTTPKEDDIPVLTIKSEMSTENMSIVVPQEVIRSTTNNEESSFLLVDNSIPGMNPDINSNENNKNVNFQEDENLNENGEKIKITGVVDSIIESGSSKMTYENNREDEDHTKSEENVSEFTTLASTDADSTNNRNIDSHEKETTDSNDISSTIPIEMEEASPSNEKDEKIDASTEITTKIEINQMPSTTQNVLEGEHPDNGENDSTEKEMIGTTVSVENENFLSTTPNVLQGEHPNDETSDSVETDLTTEIKGITNSDEQGLTTTNVLETELTFKAGSNSADTESSTQVTSTTGSEEITSTTPNVLEGEHPFNITSGSTEDKSTIAVTDEIGKTDVTTENIIVGEISNNEGSKSEDEDSSYLITNSYEMSATDNTEFTSSESTTTTTTINVLQKEQPNNRSESTKNASTHTTQTAGTDENASNEEQESAENKETSDTTEQGSTSETTHHHLHIHASLETEEATSENPSSDLEHQIENTTPTDDTSTYLPVEFFQTSSQHEEQNNAKILPTVLAKNRTNFGIEDLSDSSEKNESLPEKWLKFPEANSTSNESHREESHTEVTSTEITTESVHSPSSLYDYNSEEINADPSSISIEDQHPSSEIESEKYSSNHTKENMKLSNPELESSAPFIYNSDEIQISTDTSNPLDSKPDDSYSQADFGIYGSKEKEISTSELYSYEYGSSIGDHRTNLQSEESLTTEISTQTADTLYGSEEQSTEYVQSHSTNSPFVDSKSGESLIKEKEDSLSKEYTDFSSAETTTESPFIDSIITESVKGPVKEETKESLSKEYIDLSSTVTTTENPFVDSVTSEQMEGSERDVKESHSTEYIDSSYETTTMTPNNTDSTRNKNETETTTPKSLEDSFYNEDDTSASLIKAKDSIESSNSQFQHSEIHELFPTKDMEDSSKLHFGDYIEESVSMIE